VSQTVDGRASASRSVYLDALRAVALVRVIVYHASSWWWVTTFTAMPLMFFIAGTLYAASLERRAASRVVIDRYRRILIPYWVYLAVMVGLWGALGVLGQITPANWVGFVLPVLSINGPQGPGADTWLRLTWFALWYIQMHLILSLIGNPLRRAQRHRPRALFTALAASFAVSAVVAPALAIAIFYAVCWIAGYYHFDGRLDAVLRTRWPAVCAVTGPLGTMAFLGFHVRAPMVAAVGVALLGVFWVALAVGLEPRIEPHLMGRRTRGVISWFSQRSLTIYLWHGVALYAIYDLDLPGSSSFPVRLAWCAVLLAVAVVVFGWAEDLAARRPAQLWPRLPSARTPAGARPATIDLRPHRSPPPLPPSTPTGPEAGTERA
jgi:peptidoglycan/LPS O-acetylase OafA/YrhL